MSVLVRLDISTLLFGVCVTMLLAAVLLGTFWRRYRSEIAGIGTWTVATGLIGAGSMLFLFQGEWSSVITVCLANLLVEVGINLVGVGVCQFEERRIGRSGWVSGGVLLAATSVFVASGVFGSPGADVRIIASTLAIGAAMVFIALSLSPESRDTIAGRLLTVTSALAVLLSAVRVVYTIWTFGSLPAIVIGAPDPVQGVFVLGYFIIGIVVIFTLILFVPSRLHQR